MNKSGRKTVGKFRLAVVSIILGLSFKKTPVRRSVRPQVKLGGEVTRLEVEGWAVGSFNLPQKGNERGE